MGCTLLEFFRIKDYLADKRERKRLKELKSLLLRYFEKGQGGGYVDFSFAKSFNELLSEHLFEVHEIDIARQALIELVENGFLEYYDGLYFLKGRAPKL